MTRSEHIRALLEEYAQQRTRNETERAARVADAERRDPELARLRESSVTQALDTMRSILSLTSQEERVAAAERMKQRGIANNMEARRRLKALGLPEDYLGERFRCPICRDTGYVGEAPSRFCECFEARLRTRLHEDGSMAGVNEQNFDTFDLNRFPEEDGQRARMARARELCERYANTFPDTEILNLLMMGEGGLGKTFLLNSIYARVSDRGLSAVRVTAFKLFDAMRCRHMGDEHDDTLRSLTEAPLLLIDDLGTEPMMRNITIEYLFMLLNERIANKRHTVFATNLTPTQLKERYGERVLSRLFDKSVCFAMQFRGRDLRTLLGGQRLE